MNPLRKRIDECIKSAKLLYGGLIEIPESSSIILNKEFMLPQWMAYESQANNLNIISLNAKWVKYNEELYFHEIIPHELAHVICRVNPIIQYSSDDHCDNWKELCICMGGSGDPYIDEELVKVA